MNDQLRPALYQAYHEIINCTQHDTGVKNYDIVGPVCETADFLGKNRVLALHNADILAMLDVGAYGFSMSSNYNSRPRAAEVLVDGDCAKLIRQRETITQLFTNELL